MDPILDNRSSYVTTELPSPVANENVDSTADVTPDFIEDPNEASSNGDNSSEDSNVTPVTSDQNNDSNGSSEVVSTRHTSKASKRRIPKNARDMPPPKRAKQTKANKYIGIEMTTGQQKILDSFDTHACYDSKYLASLLNFTYTKEVLAISSYGGAKSNYTGASHIPLDAEKMKIVQSMHLLLKVQILFSFILTLVFTLFLS